MLYTAPIAVPGAPHVIVIGNEKGGSGKTTIAMHLAVALLKQGQRVGTIDLDSNQRALTRYIENRRIWANHRRIKLEIPLHRYVGRAEGAKLDDNEAAELAAFGEAVSSLKGSLDFLVIDTPSTDTYLMRLAHLVADTLLTPVTDSFLDLGSLASTDPITHEMTGTGHYAELVCDARRRRLQFDRSHADWVVIHNRSSARRLVRRSLAEAGTRLAFRHLGGCSERNVYRQFSASGLTVLDALDEAILGERPDRSHRLAQQEMCHLIELLRLPISERARRRAAAREEWFVSAHTPLDTGDLLADEIADPLPE
ncbi:division plane positioning ATPase MipZ [Bradyrhizobium sp. CER78]|uniref:division plane positioning ATPase MipZ n=1 Tax=Bradyrhizobium sp. CER78 TaxID=3039162 RepID=UPI002446DE51|nr:division plane positioning ATPase MipZ [Bradyrhizobium sp. CER78]MDH2382429.1 division plane positioning ATPase MipZ [Bradyrhizobium sp. CER78]